MVTIDEVANPSKTALIAQLAHERAEEHGGPQENPLDESETFQQLCEACRRGDVKTVQSIIAFGNVNLNAVDAYDYLPLTLASLCGHYEVAQLLLESGAICERDTFQGERILYNALNDRIRNLLLQYDYSKSLDPAQPWAAGITSLLYRPEIDVTDVTILATSSSSAVIKEFKLHKFLLAARSPYFQRKLQQQTKIRLANSFDARAFDIAVRYMYLGEVMESAPQDVLLGVEKLSRHLEIPEMWELVLVAGDPRVRRQKRSESVKQAQDNLDEWFKKFVIGQKIELGPGEKPGDVRVDKHNEMFADILLQADEFESSENEEDEANADAPRILKRSVIYLVHKAILRSEFFTIMFSSPFREGQKSRDDEPLQVIPLDMSPAVLELVLAFFYSEKVEIPLDIALDALFAADQLFIDRLKTRCAQVISTAGHTDDLPYSIYDVIRAGWLTRIHRLEEFGAKYIAERLEFFIDDKNFADLIQESAERIENRQETDTIELVDDIRYYLNERFRMRMEDMQMYEEDAEGGEVWEGEESKRTDGAESRGLNDDAKDKENMNREINPENRQEKPQPGELADEGKNLNTEAGLMYDSLLGQIDELLDQLRLDA
ncbi:uncharacterized protein H6S33_005889 [Morchella sextelata]|uniref:uncharacterized protein n=1 Tax=Morchella sextelata TaxID=1174677 RepID=UPI001D05132C|nr:uncharacterized protein H6S33_005889 [Morchella sextelata]KAH0614003.1 hypothetical protein H6S33_005889 [Morchella sextelata]